MIQLVGPGGAGKTTTGAFVADRLGVSFVDLDERFMSTVGHIGDFIDSRGYLAYAAQNVALYLTVVRDLPSSAVLALSSGFMTYPSHVHERYLDCHDAIASSPTTFVLLPSLDLEPCVSEIVRRQVGRPYLGQDAVHEERVIRDRFRIYSGLPARMVGTMRAPAAVAEVITSAVAAQLAAAADRTTPLASGG